MLLAISIRSTLILCTSEISPRNRLCRSESFAAPFEEVDGVQSVRFGTKTACVSTIKPFIRFFSEMALVKSFLPLYLKGTVIRGFGRGSKQLGFPTGSRRACLLPNQFSQYFCFSNMGIMLWFDNPGLCQLCDIF